jgi:hypothetical protein
VTTSIQSKTAKSLKAPLAFVFKVAGFSLFIFAWGGSVGRAAIQPKTYQQRCADFFGQVEKIEVSHGKKSEAIAQAEKRPVFSNAKVALEALKVADRYPGYPDNEMSLFKKALEAKGAEDEIKALSQASAGCDPGRFFAWNLRLINSAHAYHFSISDRNFLASVLVSHLRGEALNPRPVMQEVLDLKLLYAAVDKNVLRLSKEQEKELKAHHQKFTQITAQALSREAEIENLRSQIGEPIDSKVEKERQLKLARLNWDQLQNSEELRMILRQVLKLDVQESDEF